MYKERNLSIFDILSVLTVSSTEMKDWFDLTRSGARRRLQENGANFTSTLSFPVSLYCWFLSCLGAYLLQKV